MGINIRIATKDDVQNIVKVRQITWKDAYSEILPSFVFDALEDASLAEKYYKIIENNHGVWQGMYVAESKGEIVGFELLLNYEKPTLVNGNQIDGEIMALYVLPKYQGKGIGKQMLDFAKVHFKARKVKSFIVWCLKNNNKARKFYGNVGGKIIDNKEINILGSLQQEVGFYFI